VPCEWQDPVAAVAVLWWITRTATASRSRRRRRGAGGEALWGEIHKLAARSRIAYPTPNQTELEARPREYALGLSTDEGTSSRFTAATCSSCSTEAPGVQRDIWEAIEGIRAGRATSTCSRSESDDRERSVPRRLIANRDGWRRTPSPHSHAEPRRAHARRPPRPPRRRPRTSLRSLASCRAAGWLRSTANGGRRIRSGRRASSASSRLKPRCADRALVARSPRRAVRWSIPVARSPLPPTSPAPGEARPCSRSSRARTCSRSLRGPRLILAVRSWRHWSPTAIGSPR